MDLSRRKAIALGAVTTSFLFGSALHLPEEQAPADEANSSSGGAGSDVSEQQTPDQSDRPDVVDIRDYGAMGDGRTDDSKAIADAVEAAGPGETVFIPETDDSYLISFDGRKAEAGIEIVDDTSLDDLSIIGETPSVGAQTLQVQQGSYDPNSKGDVIRIRAAEAIEGLTIQNLTIDGARPEDDEPAGLGGEAALTGLRVAEGDARGGHDILIKDCIARNCSQSGFRFEESGITCRHVTAHGTGRHGFNPVAEDTTADPGFVGEFIEAVDCGGTGIDHRRGTARLEHVYTENNRSGNKWKHHVERLEVRNHRSVRDRNLGWRSNHSASDEPGFVPETQELVFERVLIENPMGPGLRISGTDTNVQYDLRGVEIRSASPQPSEGAIKVYRNAETLSSGTGHVVVVDTENGVGVSVLIGAKLDIDTYEHFANDRGAFNRETGEVQVNETRNVDPGRNVFDTPSRDNTGAFKRLPIIP